MTGAPADHSGRAVTSFTIWLIVGGLAGWLVGVASRLGPEHALPNCVLGAVGAFAGSVVAGAGTNRPPDESLASFGIMVATSVCVVLAANLVRAASSR